MTFFPEVTRERIDALNTQAGATVRNCSCDLNRFTLSVPVANLGAARCFYEAQPEVEMTMWNTIPIDR